MNRHLAGATVLIAVALALTGCSRAAASGTTPASPPAVSGGSSTSSTTSASPPPLSEAPAGSATTVPATAGASAANAGTLDGISRDLDSADNANAKTDGDQQNADQATATSDG